MIPMAVATQQQNNQVPVIPFRKATIRKLTLEPTKNLAAQLGGQDNWQISNKGYIGALILLISGTETTTTATPAPTADFPFNIFNRINLRDSAGGMLKNLTGYNAYLAWRYFQPYKGLDITASGDTRAYTVPVATVAANTIAFALNLDVEAGTRDNVGLVPNQNAAFNYTLQLNYNTVAAIMGTAANWSTSALAVQPAYEYYTVPTPQRPDNTPQQSMPPFAGVVRQVWDETQNIPATGEQRFPLVPGKVTRNLIVVKRSGAGARENQISRFKLMYGDDTLLFEMTEQELITRHYQLYGEVPPTGVYPLPFTADNDAFVGADFRRDILDTRRLSQFYLLLTCGTTGSVDIVHDELIVPINVSI